MMVLWFHIKLEVMSDREILSKEFQLLKQDLVKAYNKKGMRASGDWADSLRVEASELTAILYGNDYTRQLELGRRKGRYPNIDSIKKWIIEKGVFTATLQKIKISSLAFLIARKIAEKGWKRQGYGGVNLITEVITEERWQRIIKEVGEFKIASYVIEIKTLIEKLEVA
jgi:hypothetical protein